MVYTWFCWIKFIGCAAIAQGCACKLQGNEYSHQCYTGSYQNFIF